MGMVKWSDSAKVGTGTVPVTAKKLKLGFNFFLSLTKIHVSNKHGKIIFIGPPVCGFYLKRRKD
jgi:hypothetical protein